MELVRPSIEILESPDMIKGMLHRIEYAGRTCYKSEDRITEDSSEKFVKMLIRNGHHSVLEHEKISVKVVCDRGVTHEIVRHRIAAYSQECIAGDTVVKKQGKKQLTIKDLYDRKYGSCYDKTHNKTINLRSVNDKGVIGPNKFVDVFFKGEAEVYEVVSERGYRLKCTLNHEFKTGQDSYKKLENLSEGSEIFVNGRPSLLQISDEALREHYLIEQLSPLEISNKYGVPYTTVRRRLKDQNIFVKRFNDKNKEKYFKNHTDDSVSKMQNTIQCQYSLGGREVWNKGVKETENESVKKQAETLRRFHHDNQENSYNSNWRDGGCRPRAQAMKKGITSCEICGESNNLEVHHKDYNPRHNNMVNLIKVCCRCHNLLHHGYHVADMETKDRIKSINYVGREPVYDLEMQGPYHNYVANGFITHNSTRYCNYGKLGIKFIIPCDWDYDEEDYAMAKIVENYYNRCLEKGRTPQQARYWLPNGLKTEIVMTYDLREWRHVLDLRCTKAAHPQMREVMYLILQAFKEKVPVVFDDLWDKYECFVNEFCK